GMTIIGFLASHFLLGNLVGKGNPFLSVLGFIFLINWSSIGVWQVLAVAAAALSVAIMLWVDALGHDYRFANEHNDQQLLASTEHKFGWIEWLAIVLDAVG